MGEMSTGKICMICGEDCSSRPRVKDASGRYCCKACQAAVLTQRKSGPQPSSNEQIYDVLDSVLPSSPPPVVRPPLHCASCGRPMQRDAVVCINCGYNVQAGYRTSSPSRIDRAVQASAPWFMSPVYLYFKPSKFYANFVDGPIWLIGLFAWMYGIVGVSERMNSRMATAQLRGRSLPFPDDWGVYWAIAAGAGLFGGLVYLVIGGWWYRLRLRWSGAKDPDVQLVRRVYILASLVYAVPALLAMVSDTAMYGTPSEAFNGDLSVLDALSIFCLFVSIWTSYIGVRTVFETSRGMALLWFLILPGILYVVAIATVVVGMLMLYFIPASVSSPLQFSNQTISASYPSNWQVEDEDPGATDTASVMFQPLFQDAALRVMLLAPERSLQEEVDGSIAAFGRTFEGLRETGRFTSWGGLKGEGRSLSGRYEGSTMTVRIFGSVLSDGRMLEVHELMAPGDRSAVEPGFDLIRTTLFVRGD